MANYDRTWYDKFRDSGGYKRQWAEWSPEIKAKQNKRQRDKRVIDNMIKAGATPEEIFEVQVKQLIGD
jgi:hypothetical protein